MTPWGIEVLSISNNRPCHGAGRLFIGRARTIYKTEQAIEVNVDISDQQHYFEPHFVPNWQLLMDVIQIVRCKRLVIFLDCLNGIPHKFSHLWIGTPRTITRGTHLCQKKCGCKSSKSKLSPRFLTNSYLDVFLSSTNSAVTSLFAYS